MFRWFRIWFWSRRVRRYVGKGKGSWRSVDRLAGVGGSAAGEALIALGEDAPDGAAQWSIWRALATMDDPRVVRGITELLSRRADSSRVLQGAIEALWSRSRPDAKDDTITRVVAVLRELSGEAQRKVLWALLSKISSYLVSLWPPSTQDEEREECIERIFREGHRLAGHIAAMGLSPQSPLAAKVFDSVLFWSSQQARGLTFFSRPHSSVPVLGVMECKELTAGTALLAGFGSGYLPLLIERLSADREPARFVAGSALRRLGWLADTARSRAELAVALGDFSSAAAEGNDAVPALGRCVLSVYEDIRRGATAALGQIDDPAVVAPLLQGLREEPVPTFRSSEDRDVAEAALSHVRHAVGPLICLVKGDKDDDVRTRAARILGRIGDRNAAAALAAFLDEAMKKRQDELVAALSGTLVQLGVGDDQQFQRKIEDYVAHIVKKDPAAIRLLVSCRGVAAISLRCILRAGEPCNAVERKYCDEVAAVLDAYCRGHTRGIGDQLLGKGPGPEYHHSVVAKRALQYATGSSSGLSYEDTLQWCRNQRDLDKHLIQPLIATWPSQIARDVSRLMLTRVENDRIIDPSPVGPLGAVV